MYAYAIAKHTGLEVKYDVRQMNKVDHTHADALTRLFNRAKFEGEVKPGRKYILVDDVVTQGGTINELRKHIERNGGEVVLISALARTRAGGQIAITPELRTN